MKNTIFLTDANYKHTLAAIRSLGLHGLKVDTGSSSPRAVGVFSKHTNQTFLYPNPKSSPQQFIQFISKICTKHKYDAVIPIGYNSTVTISKLKKQIPTETKIPLTDYEQLKVAAHKDLTIALAKKLGIPVPNTYSLKQSDISQAATLKYPLVVKGTTESGKVCYVTNPKQLAEKFRQFQRMEGTSPIVQQYIRGKGYGFFTLFNQGEPRAIFMHRRIREYPTTGGPSTVAESIYQPKLKEFGLKILKALKWHGVAMVEFRQDNKDNKFKLLEINPKFWGSLDLAIASGVDFPYLLYKVAVDGDVKPVFNYRRGIRFMWPLPDDILATLANPSTSLRFLKDIANKRIKKNILINDLRPNLMQLPKTALLALRSLKNPKALHYPHGIPFRDKP